MEIIKRLKEAIMKKIEKLPFLVRLFLVVVSACLCSFYHYAMSHWGFKDCPKELCPDLSIFDNTNSWRFPERTYITHHQTMALEAWIWSVVILIPEWRNVFKKLVQKIQHGFASFYDRYILQTPPTPPVTYLAYNTGELFVVWKPFPFLLHCPFHCHNIDSNHQIKSNVLFIVS